MTFELKTQLPPLPANYPISAKIVADSITFGADRMESHRLTTLELVFPRFILAEFNTHRVFSRNTSSSRAIPTKKQLDYVKDALKDGTFVQPVRYGLNQAGMQPKKENLSEENEEKARAIWLEMACYIAMQCERLTELGLHKQWTNRPMEWFMTSKVLVSATDWNNFFTLRDHESAQDEIIYLAQAIKTAMNASIPLLMPEGGWHLPYITEEDRKVLPLRDLIKVSASRSARVSYKTFHGLTSSLGDDIALFDKLTNGMKFDDEENPFHASPTEHQATPRPVGTWGNTNNFHGWIQARQFIENGQFKALA